jgi:SpoVK/Ycf46/Vps4 family AAA+-type ATPase
MAAGVLAGELALDLHLIDLSAVLSKYVGETEKNLRRIFEDAEEGAILLFDEADALFGKRTDFADGHDRYANIEVSYLLERMDAYQGLASESGRPSRLTQRARRARRGPRPSRPIRTARLSTTARAA